MCELTTSIKVPLNDGEGIVLLIAKVIFMHLVLLGLRSIFHVSAHVNSRFISSLMVSVMSSVGECVNNMLVSSAKSLVSFCRWEGRSLIISRNIIGPRTDPWGTPARVSAQSEQVPFTDVHWRRSVKKLRSQSFIWGEKPYKSNLLYKPLWESRSNALLMSAKITVVALWSLRFEAIL